jgi:hypothetical protein
MVQMRNTLLELHAQENIGAGLAKYIIKRQRAKGISMGSNIDFLRT